MTTGKTVDELSKGCWKKKHQLLDRCCGFIWQNYSQLGYRTAYAEDGVQIANFRPGFKHQPTDYYHNVLFYRLGVTLGHQSSRVCKLCLGPRLGFQVVLDQVEKMAFRMRADRSPYFQFAWTTDLSHEHLNEGKLGDAPLLQTLQWFQAERYLNNTVFILVSDHGMRLSGIIHTLQGKIESRMPFLYFVFLEWFKEQYRVAVNNFVEFGVTGVCAKILRP